MLGLRRLKYFVAVAEAGTFTEAARRLGVSQSALSRQIMALETSLGTPLLRRGRKPLELTWAGRALLRGAREMLAQADRTLSDVRTASGDDVRTPAEL